MSEKMRVHILAKKLNVPSKTIIEKCRAEGISTVKNHMSTLSAGLHATILEWFSEGSHENTIETSERINLESVRIKRRKAAVEKASVEVAGEEAAQETAVAAAVAEAPVSEQLPAAEIAVVAGVADAAAQEIADSTPAIMVRDEELVSVSAVEPPLADATNETEPPQPAEEPDEEEAGLQVAAKAPIEEVADPDDQEATGATDIPDSVTPAGPQNVPMAAKLQGPRVVRYEAPDYDVRPPVRRAPSRPKRDAGSGAPPTPGGPPKPGDGTRTDGKGRGKQGSPSRSPGGAADKHKGHVNPRRSAGRAADAGQRMLEYRDRDLAERKQRLAGATGRRAVRRRATQASSAGVGRAPTGPKTEATVHEPIRMKEFCSQTGVNFMLILGVLRDEHQIVASINATLPTETAELLAIHFGIDLHVVKAKTLLDKLAEDFESRERKNLQPRPPIVTMLGHVDHGKTSLLDAIRESRVVAGEDGGITQHISSYHLSTAHGAVTFLDTPGHAAFTAMRARGAQVTDVVVLVIAADDGVMPQTIEAINHAKSAGVPVVVALNKIDLGEDNKLKIYGQLAEHELTPSGDWGGEVDVLPTSATTGQGIPELVQHLSDLSSLLELKADPTIPASGTTIEAETRSGVGPVARILIQEGTLRIGDCVVCGNAYGKVRALLDDRGERLKSAGPAIPIEVWGLTDVPTSGDKLYTVSNLQRAKEIALETKHSREEDARLQSSKVTTLEEMFSQREAGEIPELNIIMKTDVDGSMVALKGSLAEIPSDEVNLNIRHAGVGAVNDSDVTLAGACGGLIVAYRVESTLGARRLAKRLQVEIRDYRVIYDVCDDIKKALEGLLTPEERIESRGVAEVREVFHISKVGKVAGCYVTQGTIERNHYIKVVRDDKVVRDRAKFSSVRRHKDDVRQVRAGMECGLRLEGFDDVHVGDRIETYEIIEIARTL